MSIANWTLFIQERMRAFQSDVNLDQGSPATVQVIDPIVARLTPDPIESNLSLFIMTRLQQEHPMLYTREGSTIMDLLVKPNLVLLEPFRREIASVRNQLSLLYPEQLSADEADALMANFFITREVGSYARVRVRLYFQNPVSVNISSANVAYTGRNLRFIPTTAQSITAEGMLTNWDGNLYYFDVNYTAERPGSSYNIDADEIIGVTGLQAATRATNLTKANPGDDEESTSELIARGEQSLGERSLTTVPGIVYSLFDQFPTLKILQVIGFNDPEMNRDIMVGSSLGDVLDSGFGNDGDTDDDGDGDGYTWYFDSATGSFTTLLGPVGTDISNYNLTAWLDPGTGIYRPYDFKLHEVRGATQISIDPTLTGTDRLPDDLTGATFWCIRRRGLLTLSDIPGGIIFPSSTGEELEVPDDTVHVGGCTDFYVRGGETEDKTLALELVSDQDVVARREDAQTVAGSPVVVLNDLTAAEFALLEEGKASLYLEQGSDEGSYKIVRVFPVGPPYAVRLSAAMTANATNLSFIIVDDVDIDLVAPKEIKFEGEDLRTIAGSKFVDTVSGTPDFSSIGVLTTDTVEILEGDDADEYGIDSVAAAQIELSNTMSVTASPLAYRIFRSMEGIDLPLLRIQGMERLDSSLEPTGEEIPYRHPVDIRSRSFQNPGREATAGTDLDVTEGSYFRATAGFRQIVASTEAGLPFTTIDYWALGVRAGDILNVNSTDNQGYYTVTRVGTRDGLSDDWVIEVDRPMRWTTAAGVDMEYEIGPPSYGSFRLYFLDPCSFEATYADTLFSVEVGGVEYRFRPDPEVYREFLPTSVTIPTGVFVSGSDVVAPWTTDGASEVDLKLHNLELGDRVEVTYAPLVGSVDFDAAPTVNVDGLYVKIDVGFGTETVTFTGTSASLDEVVSQMNTQLSREVVAKYEEPSPSTSKFLMLRADRPISIISDGQANDCTDLIFGTNRQTNNPWLTADSFKSAAPGVDRVTENDSPEKGFYLVSTLAPFPGGAITLTETDGSAWAGAAHTSPNSVLGHFFRVGRAGVQGISSTAMNDQGTDDLGFYYFDVECVSEGYGEPWNIDAELKTTAEGYESEGWEVTVEDEDLSYSMSERPWIHVSPRILIVGNDEDETNKIEVVGGNVQVSYERDPMVESVQTYVSDPQTRVVCQSPLARSLFPKFVRTAITYRGGDQTRDVRSELAEYIESILPERLLEVSAMVDIIHDTGSDYVTLPIETVGIGHNADRTITTERGEDTISVGRLSALLPDDDGTTSEGASYILLTRLI